MKVKTGLHIWHECNKERKLAESECEYNAIFEKYVSIDVLKEMTHDEIIELIEDN